MKSNLLNYHQPLQTINQNNYQRKYQLAVLVLKYLLQEVKLLKLEVLKIINFIAKLS